MLCLACTCYTANMGMPIYSQHFQQPHYKKKLSTAHLNYFLWIWNEVFCLVQMVRAECFLQTHFHFLTVRSKMFRACTAQRRKQAWLPKLIRKSSLTSAHAMENVIEQTDRFKRHRLVNNDDIRNIAHNISNESNPAFRFQKFRTSLLAFANDSNYSRFHRCLPTSIITSLLSWLKLNSIINAIMHWSLISLHSFTDKNTCTGLQSMWLSLMPIKPKWTRLGYISGKLKAKVYSV